MNPLDQPKIAGNRWSLLEAPPLGGWTPTLSVSVVVPAFQAHLTLPYTLASLAVQSYPSHLLEVVVVDDGSEPPLELPELRPENTRVVRTTSSWGRAHACHEGGAAADGDVLHWYDADMVASRHEVEAQLRWHHLVDHAVVLGEKTFIDPEEGLPDVAELRAAVLEDRDRELFTDRWASPHDWVEEFWDRTDDLRSCGFRAYQVHVGATASVRRAFYEQAGGMNGSLKLGEDIELGYRLGARGAVFVADRESRSWHLGRTSVMQREEAVNRYNSPFIANLVPDLRRLRTSPGRVYEVPGFDAVVDATGASYEDVKFTVDGLLATDPGDVRCSVVGPWAKLDDARRHPLDDPDLDARLVAAEYGADPRVRLVEEAPASAFPALFRLIVPAGWRPGREALETALRDMQRRAMGLRSVLLADGSVARVERTAAFERARRLARPDEELDDVVDAVSKTWWTEGWEDGFEHRLLRPEPAAPTAPAAARERPGRAPVPAPARARATGRGQVSLVRRAARRLRRRH